MYRLSDYTAQLDNYTHWGMIKKLDPKFYWLKILHLLAFNLNGKKHIKNGYFLCKDYKKEYPYQVNYHGSVSYNLVYFEQKYLADIAADMLDKNLIHVI